MRNAVTAFAAALALAFAWSAQAELNLEDARGIWLLDEGSGAVVNDNSGNGNHGELRGGEWVEGRNGRPALSLNGVDDRAVIPDSDSLYIEGAWTITAWINVSPSENGYGHILAKRHANQGIANYAFRTSPSGDSWDAYFANNGWKGIWRQGTLAAAEKGSWLYMTATYDGEDAIRIYKNAEEIGSGQGFAAPAPRDTNEVHIGGWTNNQSETLNGMLSEVALFSGALTTDDMRTLMEDGLSTLLSVDPSGKVASSWAELKSR